MILVDKSEIDVIKYRLRGRQNGIQQDIVSLISYENECVSLTAF